MENFFRIIFLITPFLFVLSCGGGESATSFQSNSNVPLKITVNTSEEDVSQTQDLTTAQGVEECLPFVDTVSVVAQGNFPTISQQFSIGEDIVVVIPFDPDEANTVTIIVALLNNGQACCSGQATFNLNPDAANEVTIDCEKVDEICNDNSDNNGNELVDCEEEDCTGSLCDGTNINICIEGECVEPAPPITSEVDLCTDGIDNDEDEGLENGGTDCTDLDCAFDPACVEICDNGVDDPDADGEDNADCLDDACDGEPCNAEDEAFICVENECVVPENIETVCDNGLDDDEDESLEGGGIDCFDEDCDGVDCEPGIGNGAQCDFMNGDGSRCVETNCNDTVNNDNDEDGADCFDPDCASAPNCQQTQVQPLEVCFDGQDNDGDNMVDCLDPDCDFTLCDTNPESRCEDSSCVPFEFSCYDLIDNDEGGQGPADCADPDCAGRICGTDFIFMCDPQSMTCVGDELLNSCFDGLDNDGDQAVDCNDSQCGLGAVCDQGDIELESTCNGTSCDPREFRCNDGLDGDGDNMTDCADPDCSAPSNRCPSLQFEVICYDNVDEDNDQLTDCADPNCNGNVCNADPQSVCDNGSCVVREITCYDGSDNDGDSLADCDDPDCELNTCSFAPFGTCRFNTCTTFEIDCADGLDNDNDQAIDCDDQDCIGNICSASPSSICDFSTNNCVPFEFSCSDGLDGDADGQIDCFDSDCDNLPCSFFNPEAVCDLSTNSCNPFERTCFDNEDNDGDGLADCSDPDCNSNICGIDTQGGNQAICSSGSCNPREFTCFDDEDNDGDNLVDCDDPDCGDGSIFGFPFGLPCDLNIESVCNSNTNSCDPFEFNCRDGFDGDQDNLLNCDDPDCSFDPICQGN